MSVELIVATFEHDQDKAGEFLARAQKLAEDKALVLEQAAAVVKTKDGEVEITDVKEFEPKQGRLYGAITGGLLGLIGGPVGAVAGVAAGAAAGGLYARVTDRGVSNKMIKDIEAGLQPGSSALIVYVQMSWVEKAIRRLEDAGATVAHTTLDLSDVGDLL